MKQTLSGLVDDYLRTHIAEQSTKDLTKYAFRLLIEIAGNLSVTDADLRVAQQYQVELLKRMGEASVNRNTKSVRAVFNWCVDMGNIEKNPFSKLRLLKVPKRNIRNYSADSIRALLGNSNKIWQGRILAAVTAGLRKGETLNLTIADVDFEKEILYVREKKETKTTWRWKPKDKDLRCLPLSKDLANVLTEILLDLPEGQPYLLLTRKQYQDNLELRKNGNLSERQKKEPDYYFNPAFKKIKEMAGIGGLTFHDLRRTWCSELIKNGLPAHELQKLAGHSDITTTLTYYVQIDEQSSIIKARESISNFIRGDRT